MFWSKNKDNNTFSETEAEKNPEKETDSAIASANNLIGYRFSVTGGFGYSFLRGNEEIVTVSALVVPDPPVTIRGNGIVWESPCFVDTIVPGVSRYVKDKTANRIVGKLTYIDREQYRINDSVTLRCGIEKTVVFRDDQPIAQISHCQEKRLPVPDSLDPYYDWMPYFEVSVSQNVDNELLSLICAFPMLKFD